MSKDLVGKMVVYKVNGQVAFGGLCRAIEKGWATIRRPGTDQTDQVRADMIEPAPAAPPRIQLYAQGMPWGSYSVTYYRMIDGRMVRQKGDDTQVSEKYVRRVAADLRENEALIATCDSQPGGCEAYGSRDVATAMASARL